MSREPEEDGGEKVSRRVAIGCFVLLVVVWLLSCYTLISDVREKSLPIGASASEGTGDE